MLWLSIYFPQFALDIRPSRESTPLAITDKHGSRRWLIACNVACQSAGIHRGMDVTGALARDPTLKLVERSKSSERQAMKACGAWAEQYSNSVFFDPSRWMLWIEIGASLTYFGGLDALVRNIDENIESLGYSVRFGVAPTVEAAAIFAVAAQTGGVQHKSKLIDALSPLPIRLLNASPDTIEALKSVGWQRIGEILALPRDQLSRRFGPEFTLYIEKLVGAHPDPREPYRAPTTYRRRFDFADPIHNVEAMLFPLRRMLSELQGFLRGRDTALQRLTLELRHHKQQPTLIELRTTAPQRDSGRLLALLREQLDRTLLPADITELALTVDQFVALGDTQLDLFNTTPKRENDWADLLDKLRARLGDNAVKRLGLSNDHRPEKAWCVVHQDQPEDSVASALNTHDDEPERPFWLLDPTPL
ncbi:MAG TPA: DNA polymerase Y family protein, partial [Steroidobacteraceae bacterium]|nr:DNA polymerase Y family protein [Steroidobacteraceae bacterium]